MRYQVLLQHLTRASVVALIVNLQAQLLLPPGNPAGTMTATLPGGPVGHIAFHSSSATPDDAGNFTAQVHSAVTVGNSFGLETLTFWYQVTNMDQIPNGSPLVSLGIPMPAAAAVIVDQSNSGRLASLALNTGSSVSLFWTVNPINEGQFSAWLSMETPHIFYMTRTISVIDGTSEEVAALVPWAAGGGLVGDLDGDDTIDLRDLRLLMAAIRNGTNLEDYDCNADGKVDAADARWLILHFTP